VELDSHEIAITRPAKVLFPQDGITKGELIEYYARIAPVMLPHLRDRPLVMQRYPDGLDGPGFIQKSVATYYPKWIRRVTVRKVGGVVVHAVAADAATLVYLANQACVSFHTWLSRANQVERPDQIVWDFDPSRDTDLAGVVAGALALKELLEELNMPAYARATGSRGVHVVVPLTAKQDFDTVRSFSRRLAGILVDRDPARFTLEQRKADRGGRIFIDTNRNGYAQSAIATYSVRARAGAPVAVPLDWSELRKKSFRPDAYNIRNVFQRLQKFPDPWKDFRRRAVSLQAAGRRLDRLHAA
jgi:bifunctional non-homologous end joining protein LigD